MKDLRPLECAQPIVFLPVQVDDARVLAQQVDGGQEPGALKPVPVEVFRQREQ